ncbi:MAG: polysaccharide deacetylase family protein [Actinomycetota bacterium]|nr:polysaccharide deacetylase family protein [Actinomycetota bacterium]
MSDTVVILAYHALDEGPGPVCLPPAAFERQVRGLASAGSVCLSLGEVAEHVRSGTPFPERAVSITFDDGYESTHRRALPVLDSIGWRATVFPVTQHLGGSNAWDTGRGIPELPLLSATALLELVSAGWEVGGHTHSHRPLTAMALPEVVAEIERSTDILQELSGGPVCAFAYPYGRHDPSVRQVAARTHDACLAIGAAKASLHSSLDHIQRVDAWYIQHPLPQRHLHDRWGDAYLAARRAARRVGARLRGAS